MTIQIQQTPQPAPRLLTAREVAAFFSVTARTIGRWRQDGLIPYVLTPGGTYRYNPIEVEQALMVQG